MLSFEGQHILSVKQLDRSSIERILQVAHSMEPYAKRLKRTSVLDGAVLANLFFEPSTRTRVSFSTAFKLLGGNVSETVGMTSSSLSKGESLYDTARVVSGYADVIAMRHPQSGSVAEFASGSLVPVINGGDGPNEHPTQALLDMLTIETEMARQGRGIDGLHIAMMGDLRFGRTVHSLSKVLRNFNNITFTFIAAPELAMPHEVLDLVSDAGHRINIVDSLDGHIAADVLYQTRIQEERFPSQEEANLFRGKFRLNQQIYQQHFAEHTVIMHPLPRDARPEANELDNDLNDNPNLAIFRQTDNGILARMALFALALGVENKLGQFESTVPWHSAKKLG